MAIYHLRISGASKTTGSTAVSKYDYICRENKYENQPDNVIFKESVNIPNWAESPRDFWHSADQHERANGRLFTEIEFALPKELSIDEQLRLTRAFASDLTNNQHPYSYALHHGKGHNPHVHLMFSERPMSDIGKERFFSRDNPKNRELRGPKWVHETRALWADKANHALKEQGIEQRIDHRSYLEQGNNLIPTRHLGPQVLAMEKEGISTELGVQYREIMQLRKDFDLERDQLKAELLAHDQKLEQQQKLEEQLEHEKKTEYKQDFGLEL